MNWNLHTRVRNYVVWMGLSRGEENLVLEDPGQMKKEWTAGWRLSVGREVCAKGNLPLEGRDVSLCVQMGPLCFDVTATKVVSQVIDLYPRWWTSGGP